MKQRHLTLVAVLLFLLAGFSGTVAQQREAQRPQMFRGGPNHSGVYATEGVEELGSVKWRFRTGGPVRSTPVAMEDLIHVGSSDGRLYALDRATGHVRWQVEVGSPVSSSPALTHDLVLFGSRDGVFHALDRRSGARIWRFETGPEIPWEWGLEGWDIYTSSPVVWENRVVFGAGDGVVYALDLTDGTEIWRFSTGGRIRSTPAVAEGVVFVGSTDGIVYALSQDTGEEIWRHETAGAGVRSENLGVDRKSIIASPAVVDGTVYIGSRDGFMYALDQGTGAQKWRFSHDGSWAMSSAAIYGGKLYAGTSDDRFVHSVDVGTGEEDWRFIGAGYTWSSPCVAGDLIYIGDGGGYLRAIDRMTGEERWNFDAPGGVYSSPLVSDGTVYVGAEDGSVYALHGEGRILRRAVYWDEEVQDLSFNPSHLAARVFFELQGYEVLDSEGLASFMEARIADEAPSVVVFAMDHLPTTVAAEPADTVLFRRYVAEGGRAVWLGVPPMIVARDSAGAAIALDRSRPSSLLDVDFSDINFDFYASNPTELGRAWGLERGWVSYFSVSASEGVEILGEEETGRAAAWIKNYGGKPGSGFVNFPTGGATLENLTLAQALAEHGLGRTRE